MLRILLVLAATLSGCILQSEPKTKVIQCGDIEFDRMTGELRDTVTVKDGKCSSP
jgi:hypothetical protein